MDTESVRSGKSERSERSMRSKRRFYNLHSLYEQPQVPSQFKIRSEPNECFFKDDRSNSLHTNNKPVCDQSEAGVPGLCQRNQQTTERIEVQILQQDDNWGDNTTAITGNTSEAGFSIDDMAKFSNDIENSVGFTCARYIGTVFTACFSLITILSPIAMLLLPKIHIIDDWTTNDCDTSCEGLFISFSFKVVVLLIGAWCLLWRTPKATLPRIAVMKAFVLFLATILIFAFWLFYGVRIIKTKETSYHTIVKFAVSLVDSLLFLHYAALILLKLKHMTSRFVVHVVRSPDGIAKSYLVGDMSIQRLAVFTLENYFRDFDAYNPYLDNMPKRNSRSSYKVYNVDGPHMGNHTGLGNPRPPPGSDTRHNDRFYDEMNYERRLKKRRARLVAATDEAFSHIKRMQNEQGPAIPMDPSEAAQAIFPSLARALQKYLRITRQQPRYSMESILRHLALCIGHDMGPKAFLEKFLTQGSIIMNDKEYSNTQTWVLICDQLVSRNIEHGSLIQLRQGDVALLINIRKIPHFNLTEEVIDHKCNKFVLKLNSETPCRIENLSRVTAPVLNIFLQLFCIQYELRGVEHLQLDQPYVLMANHQSSLDLIEAFSGMLKYLPDRMTILGKKELKYLGTFGIAAWLSGLIFVDRTKKRDARKTMDQTVEIILKDKAKLWVFPEGTRHMGKDFLPFKKGGFHIAQQAQIPIVPLVFSSYANFLDSTRKHFEAGKVILTALPPIQTKGLTTDDVDDLVARVRNEMFLVYQATSKEALEKYYVLPKS
ncbi:DgyrCDS3386 [Dimorphilus gyrociliatus]|uniref:1-acyl-sn-glycerol-3-phosphate acyltransferase n=1 Tax=Dimorphilus gyrociliatus TaxID=2664684 RepID=A0A7I8VDJ1_9ANNE|nr:DgyrCDS3386 [Dimorphilus gyrociliatus]